MSAINGLGTNIPVQKVVNSPVYRSVGAEAPKQLPMTDKLELSGMGHLLQTLKANDVRMDKVAAVKSQIEAGNYEDDAKLDVAVDRLLDDLLK